MQLKIHYRDKSSRIVNLAPEFFWDTKITNSRTGRQEPITPQQKALSLADCYGRYPYMIVLTRGEKTLMHHVNSYNKPMTKEELRRQRAELMGNRKKKSKLAKA